MSTDTSVDMSTDLSVQGVHKIHMIQDMFFSWVCEPYTVEPRFNKPLFNEVLDIMNDTLRPVQNYSKMYGTEPRYNKPQYNEPRYNEFLDITKAQT